MYHTPIVSYYTCTAVIQQSNSGSACCVALFFNFISILWFCLNSKVVPICLFLQPMCVCCALLELILLFFFSLLFLFVVVEIVRFFLWTSRGWPCRCGRHVGCLCRRYDDDALHQVRQERDVACAKDIGDGDDAFIDCRRSARNSLTLTL